MDIFWIRIGDETISLITHNPDESSDVALYMENNEGLDFIFGVLSREEFFYLYEVTISGSLEDAEELWELFWYANDDRLFRDFDMSHIEIEDQIPQREHPKTIPLTDDIGVPKLEFEALYDLEKNINKKIVICKKNRGTPFSISIENGHVIKLNIIGYLKRLTRLPNSIGNLSHLITLDLKYSSLERLPDTICNLKLLKNLDLKGGKITILPDCINGCESLESIELTFNNLTSLPKTIGGLKSLKILGLHRNTLKSLPETLGDLGSLENLNVGSNQLTSLPESIGNLVNLVNLNVSSNQLTSLPESIGNLMNLENLNVSFNQLTSLPESIGNLKSLEGLTVNRNQITSLPASIGNLRNLESLMISDNRLRSLPKSLFQLGSLKFLHVDGNPFQQNLNYDYLSPWGSESSLAYMSDKVKTLHRILKTLRERGVKVCPTLGYGV